MKHTSAAVPSYAFKRFAISWLDEVKTELKSSSQAKYRNIIYLYLIPNFGKEKVVNISREKIMKFSAMLLKSGGVRKRGLSPSMVNSILTVLKRILDFAAQRIGITPICFRKLRISVQKPSIKVLRRSEQKRLWDYLCENPSPCNLGLILATTYGLRIGEICALRWRDVNFEDETISITRTLMRKQTFSNNGKKTEIVFSSLKSAFSEREIPLTPKIFEILTSQHNTDDAFVLTGSASRFMEPRSLTNQFKKVLRACKIRDVKFHTLRHTYATYWMEMGYDVKTLSEILGHSSVNVTLNHYVHPSMERKRRDISDFSKKIYSRNKK